MFGWLARKRPPKSTPPSPEPTTDRLVEVLRAYHGFAASHASDLDAGALLDETRLPFAKYEILDALCRYLMLEKDAVRRESVEALALDLASFQPGVGREILLPKDEALRRLVTGPMNAKTFTDIYDRVDEDAERYSVLQQQVRVDLKGIEERVGKARAQATGKR